MLSYILSESATDLVYIHYFRRMYVMCGQLRNSFCRIWWSHTDYLRRFNLNKILYIYSRCKQITSLHPNSSHKTVSLFASQLTRVRYIAFTHKMNIF